MLDLVFEEEETPLSGLTEAEYHNHSACSASTLKRILFQDEAYEVANGIKVDETPFMVFGTLVHCLVLEPFKFENEFIVMPKVDGRTKEGKTIKAEFDEKANGRHVISEDDYQRALDCVASLKESGAFKLFEGGENEKRYLKIFKDIPLYNEEGTEIIEYQDVEVRGMLDSHNRDKKRVVDLKITQTYGVAFKKEAGNRGHGMQLSFYNDLAEDVTERIIVGIQAVKPHKITIVKVPDLELETGRDFYRVGLEIWLDIQTYPHKYASTLCYNRSDESPVFEYSTPFWQHLEIDKLRKKGVLHG